MTGSLNVGETHADAAVRELYEETGLSDHGVLEYAGIQRSFVIDPRWRDRYSPGTLENTEHEYRYRLPAPVAINFCRREHSAYRWLPVREAIDEVWSWTNREALEGLLE